MSDPLDGLRAAIDAAKAIQADIDAMGKPAPEPMQLPQQVPEALRYIMWRYWQDHSGEDHRQRHEVATEWLAGVSMSVQPAGPMVELTPVRAAALRGLAAIGEMQGPLLASPAREIIAVAVRDVWAMLAEVEAPPKSA